MDLTVGPGWLGLGPVRPASCDKPHHRWCMDRIPPGKASIEGRNWTVITYTITTGTSLHSTFASHILFHLIRKNTSSERKRYKLDQKLKGVCIVRHFHFFTGLIILNESVLQILIKRKKKKIIVITRLGIFPRLMGFGAAEVGSDRDGLVWDSWISPKPDPFIKRFSFQSFFSPWSKP